MHRTSNPYAARLSTADQAVLDRIRARSIDRFGFDCFRMEEAGGEGAAAGEQAGAAAGAAAGEAAGQAAEQADQAAAAQHGVEKVEDLPDWAQKLLKDTREEAAGNRTKATAAEKQQAQTLDAIAKALGLKKDEAPDPAKLAEQLGQTQAQAKQSAIELAVFRGASKHQGDPDALLDSRAFLAKLGDLDPTAKDFTAKVDTAIKDAVKDNPKLQSGRAPGKGSADHGAGGSGEHGKREPKSLSDAVAGHYGS